MKQVFNLILLAFAALLAGCATAPTMQPQAREGVVYGGATLALVGTCQTDVAAEYTVLVLSRQRAARELRAKKIPVADAIKVQELADTARAHLEAACPSPGAKLDAARRDAARTALATITKILEK